MELKTLKDFDYFELDSPEGEIPGVKAEVYVSCDCGKQANVETTEPANFKEVPIEKPLIKRDDLKQEAIKWIKHFRGSEELKRDKSMVVDWIAGFFNITEEDLE